MSEETKRLHSHMQGKVIQLDYDFITSLEGECTYCLTDAQVQIILGMLDYVGWKTRWYSESGIIDEQTILELQAGLGERLMSCCCDDTEIIFRWTEGGELEQSDDGGETWTPCPEKDPRNNSPTYPPVIGEPSPDKNCISATGMVMLIKEQVANQLTEDMSRFTLTELIETWVTTYIETSNPFQALMQIVANQIFALLVGNVMASLTEAVWDKLTCIFMLNMGADLSFNQAQWEGVRSQILSDIPGIAGVFLEHLVYLLGAVGLTNLARSQAAIVGDCDCSDSCADNWIVLPLNGTIINRVGNSVFVQTAFYAPEGVWLASIGYNTENMDCCKLSGMAWTNATTVGISQVLWLECGETRGVTPYHTSTAAPINHCINTMAAKMNGDCIVEYILTPCD